MGWWKSQNGVIGDQPADIMDGAIKAIEQVYMREAGRLPTQGEIADLIQFCSGGVFDVACGDGQYPFSKSTLHDKHTPRRRKPGEQGASGEANKFKTGELGNVDPKSGDHFETGELENLVTDQVKDASGEKEVE